MTMRHLASEPYSHIRTASSSNEHSVTMRLPGCHRQAACRARKSHPVSLVARSRDSGILLCGGFPSVVLSMARGAARPPVGAVRKGSRPGESGCGTAKCHPETSWIPDRRGITRDPSFVAPQVLTASVRVQRAGRTQTVQSSTSIQSASPWRRAVAVLRENGSSVETIGTPAPQRPR